MGGTFLRRIAHRVAYTSQRDKFFEAVSSKTWKNPETGNQVKMETLAGEPKSSDAYQMYLKEYKKWLGKNQTDDDGKDVDFSDKKTRDAFQEAYDRDVRDFVPYAISKEIRYYTEGLAYNMNIALRSGGKLDKDQKSCMSKLDKLFDSPQGKFPLSIKVSRFIQDSNPLAVLLDSDALKEGYTFQDPGFTSTTVHPGSMGNFKTWLDIDVPKGTRAFYVQGEPYSIYDEYEVVIDRDTTYEVVGIDTSKEGQRRIKLRIVSQRSK